MRHSTRTGSGALGGGAYSFLPVASVAMLVQGTMLIRQGLELKALTEEMLRLDPLLTLREAVGPILLKNRHPLNQNMLLLRLHLTDLSSPQRGCPPGIDVNNTAVSTVKTVKPTHTSPKRDQDRPVQAQDLAAFKTDIAAMMRDMIKSSLIEFGVVPKATPPHSHSHSLTQRIRNPLRI